MERDLFFRDLEALLETVKGGLPDAGHSPTSSPPE
jgi:hypothetical protein